MKTSIPICLSPMRKMIIHHDKNFIQQIMLKFPKYQFEGYSSITPALRYLLHDYRPSFIKANLLSTLDSSFKEYTININLDTIKHLLFARQMPDISVLLFNNLDILPQIEHLPMKKILITTHDPSDAIDAQHNNLIDAYLNRNDEDFLMKLQTISQELEWKFFQEVSDIIHGIPHQDYLKNRHFLHFFSQFVNEHDISIFYLLDTLGSFIAYDAEGNKKYFLVRNKALLNQISQLSSEDNATSETTENIKQGKVIPFFGDKECWQIPASEWGPYLHAAQELPGDPNIVWAIAIDPIGE